MQGSSIVLHYDTGGDPVTGAQPGPRQAVVTVSCGPAPWTLSTYLDGAQNRKGTTYLYGIIGTSQYACGAGGKVSGGGIFMILLLVCVVVYLLGGVIYSKAILKEPGILVFPPAQVAFWHEAPGLAKDGVMWTLGKVTQGKFGYTQV